MIRHFVVPFLIVALAFSLYFFIQPVLAPYSESQVLELVENTPYCFSDCHAIIKIKNPSPFAMMLSGAEFLKWADVFSGSPLQEFKFQLLTDEQYTYYEPNTTTYEKREWIASNSSWVTSYPQNGTLIEKTGVRKVYKDVSSLSGISIPASQEIYLRLEGKKTPKVGPNDIDWKISFYFGGYNYSPNWAPWNSSFDRAKTVQISASSLSQNHTDFVMPINVTYDSDMQADFNDVVFSYYNETALETPINYYLERKVDSSFATFWVKMPFIHNSSAINNTIKVYYKNKTAFASESTNSTFYHASVFDEQSNGEVPTAWAAYTGSPSFTVDSSESFAGNSMHVTWTRPPFQGVVKSDAPGTMNNHQAVDWQAKHVGTGSGSTINQEFMTCSIRYTDSTLERYSGGWANILSGLSLNQWTQFRLAKNGTTCYFYLNRDYKASWAQSGAIGNNRIGADYDGSKDVYVDNLLWLRDGYGYERYPQYSFGTEESKPTINSIAVTPVSPSKTTSLNCGAGVTNFTNTLVDFMWWKNSALFSSAREVPVSNSFANTTLSNSSFVKNDELYCNATAYAVSDLNLNATNQSSVVKIQDSLPTLPQLLKPDGLGSDIIPEFNWTNSFDADGDAITYRMELDNDPDFSSNVYVNDSVPQDPNGVTGAKPSGLVQDNTYYWRVRASSANGTGFANSSFTSARTFQYALWTIQFNVTDSVDGTHLTRVRVTCSNGWNTDGFPGGNADSPFNATNAFAPGGHTCTFSKDTGYYPNTTGFTADSNKIVVIRMSQKTQLTPEEHNWLQALHNCIITGNCTLYNTIVNINTTTNKIWNQFKRTDQSIVAGESIANLTVGSTQNISINYSINVPTKEGYGVQPGIQGWDDFLPIRISYWFLDGNNATCYNQGTKPIGVESPYCQPLTIQTVGQINTTSNFTVEIRPTIPPGQYYMVRNVEIDPKGVWIDYGQEIIGKITVMEQVPASIGLRGAAQDLSALSAGPTGFSLFSLASATNISLLTSIVTLVFIVGVSIFMFRIYFNLKKKGFL